MSCGPRQIKSKNNKENEVNILDSKIVQAAKKKVKKVANGRKGESRAWTISGRVD